MAGGNAALIREILRRWSAGDLDGTLDLFAPDVTFALAGLFVGAEREYHGHDRVREFWSIFREPWETISMEAPEVEEIDETRVLTRTRFRGVGLTSGVETRIDLMHLWTLRDERLLRFESFRTEEEARAAAGRPAES